MSRQSGVSSGFGLGFSAGAQRAAEERAAKAARKRADAEREEKYAFELWKKEEAEALRKAHQKELAEGLTGLLRGQPDLAREHGLMARDPVEAVAGPTGDEIPRAVRPEEASTLQELLKRGVAPRETTAREGMRIGARREEVGIKHEQVMSRIDKIYREKRRQDLARSQAQGAQTRETLAQKYENDRRLQQQAQASRRDIAELQEAGRNRRLTEQEQGRMQRSAGTLRSIAAKLLSSMTYIEEQLGFMVEGDPEYTDMLRQLNNVINEYEAIQAAIRATEPRNIENPTTGQTGTAHPGHPIPPGWREVGPR